jgi:hypothetical protein
MKTFTIEEIEKAINILRSRQPSGDRDYGLCEGARLLARPYTLMFLARCNSISTERLPESDLVLSEGELATLADALSLS